MNLEKKYLNIVSLVCSVFFFLFSRHCLAETMPREKVQTFLKDKCSFAIGFAISDQPTKFEKMLLGSELKTAKVGDMWKAPGDGFSVFCVFDGITNEGTINEKNGCFLGLYDLSKNKYSNFLNVNTPVYNPKDWMLDGEKCSKESVIKLLTRKTNDRLNSIGDPSDGLWGIIRWFKFKQYDLEVSTPFIDQFGIYDQLHQISMKILDRETKENEVKKKKKIETDKLDKIKEIENQKKDQKTADEKRNKDEKEKERNKKFEELYE